MTLELINTWKNWTPTTPPHALNEDYELLIHPTGKETITIKQSWEDVYNSSDFEKPDDTRFHLGLLPKPYIGDLQNATIFILLLNPGLSPDDYYGEFKVPEFRKSVLSNIRQDFGNDDFPFLFLNPKYAWHAGFEWWHNKLKDVIKDLSTNQKISFAEARKKLAQRLACIELLPYHSKKFSLSEKQLRKLSSTQLSIEFVEKFVVPKVKRREAIVIVTRKTRFWNLPENRGVILYNAGQARGASLSSNSPGGRAILNHIDIDL